MSIDIKNLTQTQPRSAGESRGASDVAKGARSGGGTGFSGPVGDKVTLTETARRLSTLEQNVRAQPSVDQEKVEAIRQAIQEGRYEVNAESVANKILKTEDLF
ncbi:anti-sigma-28 factor FlgM [Ectothiorhodospira sp. PHS-1]|uniref:flagellar biosynthesis anti-sigma factor FlgM n=1 Tax=Ectothiorhodospira sp. PHS-1 TaxID=519989 RepID=UPI00024A8374|nr:flagellar biosynthesis anti-sigma factor FlgM [Ectothiorhodospira sp. PHS-1]EHQ52159.1 anti-sigma-28 factor FlgM [Ectothiorhodospira sp. PHS-1]